MRAERGLEATGLRIRLEHCSTSAPIIRVDTDRPVRLKVVQNPHIVWIVTLWVWYRPGAVKTMRLAIAQVNPWLLAASTDDP